MLEIVVCVMVTLVVCASLVRGYVQRVRNRRARAAMERERAIAAIVNARKRLLAASDAHIEVLYLGSARYVPTTAIPTVAVQTTHLK